RATAAAGRLRCEPRTAATRYPSRPVNPRAISLSALLHAGAIVALAGVAGSGLRSRPLEPPTLRLVPAEPRLPAAALAGAGEPLAAVVVEPLVEPEQGPLGEPPPRPFERSPARGLLPEPQPPSPAELLPERPAQRL